MVAGYSQGVVMGLGIITAIFGSFDDLHALPPDHGFDEAVCVTDNPDLSAEGWRVVVQQVEGHHPRLTAKRAKMMPWEYLTTTSSVWIDGSRSVTGATFRPFVERHLATNDLVMWDHPEPRDCLYQEAAYCQDWGKYAGWPIRDQVAAYRAEGMPENFGLWCASVIGMRHTEQVRAFGQAWLDEQHRWSIQDQVSLPYLLWKHGKSIATWDAHEFNNDFIHFHPHKRFD